jgi:hypothetical protein
LKALTASLAHTERRAPSRFGVAWGPKRDGAWSEEFRSAPSYVEIKARAIDRPLNLKSELKEKPGPNRKTRVTLLWRRQEAGPALTAALKAFRAASTETEGAR